MTEGPGRLGAWRGCGQLSPEGVPTSRNTAAVVVCEANAQTNILRSLFGSEGCCSRLSGISLPQHGAQAEDRQVDGRRWVARLGSDQGDGDELKSEAPPLLGKEED